MPNNGTKNFSKYLKSLIIPIGRRAPQRVSRSLGIIIMRDNMERLTKIFLLFGLCVSVTSCSGDSINDKIDITLDPKRPVVINADLSMDIDGDGELDTVAAPWFPFSFKVNNKSDKTIVIQTFTFNLRAVKDGSIVEYENSIDPGLADLTSLEIINPETEVEHSLTWFIPGLPESDSFIFQGTATAIGWSVGDDGIEDRVEVIVPMTTQ